jgi:hypothetical protein
MFLGIAITKGISIKIIFLMKLLAHYEITAGDFLFEFRF